jgi:outer membrane protein
MTLLVGVLLSIAPLLPGDTTLTLAQAMRLAQQRGTQAAVARTNAAIAGERIGERRAELLPTINGFLGWSRSTQNIDEFGLPIGTGLVTDPFNVTRARLSASHTLLDLPALTRLRAAGDSAEAAASDASAAGAAAATRAGAAYVRLQGAEATIAARQADSALASDLLSQARQLAEAGVGTNIDVTRNEVNLSATATALVLARGERDRSRIELLRAVALPLDTRLTLADSLGAEDLALPASEEEAVAVAVANRPELAAERQRTEVAELTRRAIGQENLPSAQLSGYAQESAGLSSDFNGTWNVAVGLVVPILDGFRRQRRHAEQTLRIEAQQLREADTGRQVDAEARSAVIDLRSAREQIAVAGRRVELAELELQQAQERFTAGVAGSVETTNAQRGLVAAMDALIQARVSLDVARVTAYRALGLTFPGASFEEEKE